MFVTCTPQSLVKDHPEEVVVVETSVNGTVLANQNDPAKVVIVLEQAQELLSEDKSPKETTEMTSNEPFLRRSGFRNPNWTIDDIII